MLRSGRSLLAGLLAVLDRNIRAGAETRLPSFEVGRVFDPPSGVEKRRVGILLWVCR